MDSNCLNVNHALNSIPDKFGRMEIFELTDKVSSHYTTAFSLNSCNSLIFVEENDYFLIIMKDEKRDRKKKLSRF